MLLLVKEIDRNKIWLTLASYSFDKSAKRKTVDRSSTLLSSINAISSASAKLADDMEVSGLWPYGILMPCAQAVRHLAWYFASPCDKIPCRVKFCYQLLFLLRSLHTVPQSRRLRFQCLYLVRSALVLEKRGNQMSAISPHFSQVSRIATSDLIPLRQVLPTRLFKGCECSQ
ncbi:hypothetical protein RRG08_035270 [Elysia crispata]|uniref:Uncharacterized protein n=1 Tax=Elysia crispata TaxID=231223 RepID=A0AAE0ZWG8_9GAST|nr:hypothetical protein RRG08_035270 [Elysia crispata]